MENQINNSDFVLVVSSKSYYEKCYSKTIKSKGISWEVGIVYQHIYDAGSENTKFIPIFFDADEEQYILTPLKSFTYYNVGTKDGFDKLYWRLRGITKTQKPPLGKLIPLPEKERKTMFFSTPIDLDKWNSARWKGMLYLFSPGMCPVLGLLYRNYEAGKAIFSEWKRNSISQFSDDFLKVDYIEPPFPQGAWICSDRDHNYGKGYFVHIGPNIDASIDRGVSSGIKPEEMLLMMVSRYQWMDEINGSQNRDLFKRLVTNNSGYLMLPIGIINESKPIDESNLIIDFKYAIQLRNATFKTGASLRDDDICKVVLKQPEVL